MVFIPIDIVLRVAYEYNYDENLISWIILCETRVVSFPKPRLRRGAGEGAVPLATIILQ